MEELRDIGSWRIAVWALRLGYGALTIALAGIIMVSLGSTPWVLAVGVIAWLAAAFCIGFGFVRTKAQLPPPRPGFWSMRATLIYDSVHVRTPATHP